MLGLSPLPPRTDLHATITGRVEHAEFFVEKLHYQSLPGLYVTGNLYVPKNLSGTKVPAILYGCGHGGVKESGVSYGNKTTYQQHGAWFARHGYVCLIIDTIQLGELEGLHHGTYREGMWWWNARGYTPEGVEVWNSMRGIDYLQSRPEVDGEKIGMTGRSGGGAYTWYTTAVDERIKAAVPVAGITDLHNHVVDGVVAGHCDCMYMVNTYRWDYAKLAAMVAPRPLLFSNTDKDRIFPLDGVQRVHRDVAKIYQLYQAADKLGLLITEGPHKDTQDLQVPAFRWFNRFLKGEEPQITVAAEKFFTPKELRVFPVGGHPADQRTTRIHESFVPMATAPLPANQSEWQKQQQKWKADLLKKSFAGWPVTREAHEPHPVKRLETKTIDSMQVTQLEYTSQSHVYLPIMVYSRGALDSMKRVQLHVADDRGWKEVSRLAASNEALQRGEVAVAYLAPRGIGPTAPSGDAKHQVQVRRRYMLLGQTVDAMRVWDIRRAVEVLRQPDMFGGKPIHLSGDKHQAINALYASLYIDNLASVELIEPPASHMTGPDYLNVLRILDVPQAALMAADRHPVKWTRANPDDWAWTTKAAQQLGLPAHRLQWSIAK